MFQQVLTGSGFDRPVGCGATLASYVWWRQILLPIITFILFGMIWHQLFWSANVTVQAHFFQFLHLSHLPFDRTCPKCSPTQARPNEQQEGPGSTGNRKWAVCYGVNMLPQYLILMFWVAGLVSVISALTAASLSSRSESLTMCSPAKNMRSRL